MNPDGISNIFHEIAMKHTESSSIRKHLNEWTNEIKMKW